MSANNVKTLRTAHESWNKHDFAGVIDNAAEKLTYTDHARVITLDPREKFREWTEGWARTFSDGRKADPQYVDAGNVCHRPVHRRRHQRRGIRVHEAEASKREAHRSYFGTASMTL